MFVVLYLKVTITVEKRGNNHNAIMKIFLAFWTPPLHPLSTLAHKFSSSTICALNDHLIFFKLSSIPTIVFTCGLCNCALLWHTGELENLQGSWEYGWMDENKCNWAACCVLLKSSSWHQITIQHTFHAKHQGK